MDRMKIILRNVSKEFQGHQVLSNLNAELDGEQVHVIMGESGCGKTTLLRILLGLETAEEGSVEGVPKACSVVFQEDRLCEGHSVMDNLAMVLRGKNQELAIMKHLAELGIADSCKKSVSRLSGGMKRRVAIARAMLAPSDLVIMDEPFKGLDENTRKMTVSYVKAHLDGRMLVLVTHDREDVEAFAACLWELRDGKLKVGER